MGLPYLENVGAIPALLERLRTRAPDEIYPDTLEAVGLEQGEYRNVNRLLYFLKFYLAGPVDGRQVISSFWKDRYFGQNDHKLALGWMLRKRYGFIYDRVADPANPSEGEVAAVINSTRYIDDAERPHTNKIVQTFLALHREADPVGGATYGDPFPEWYVISGVMPPDNSPPTLGSLLGQIKPVWWLVAILAVLLLVNRCNLDAARGF